MRIGAIKMKESQYRIINAGKETGYAYMQG